MAVILHIETSTTVCSVALSENGVCLLHKIDFEAQSHARLLPLFLQDVSNFLQEKSLHVDAVAVSSGPGSYTGLRIGVSTAKGLCYGWNVPLIAIDTLKIMANAFLERQKVENDVLLCPMIDARRMEVYTAFYDTNLSLQRTISADIIESGCYDDLLEEKRICFFGNGSTKCEATLNHHNASFFENVFPSAQAMIHLAENAFFEKDFKDIAYFEPFYLKQFIATVPKQKF